MEKEQVLIMTDFLCTLPKSSKADWPNILVLTVVFL